MLEIVSVWAISNHCVASGIINELTIQVDYSLDNMVEL